MKKYYYCDLDVYGQRTGFVCSLELPDVLVKNDCDLLWLSVSLVHSSGFVESRAMLYDNEADCTKTALY